MELRIEKSAVVITPTVGRTTLSQAMESVIQQTYKNVTHLVVVDGPEYFDNVMESASIHTKNSNVIITTTPFNTGQNGYNGQRIYASYPHLLNHDYILFLDEDNWYMPDHIESLITLIEEKNYDWAYSMRNIYMKDGTFLIEDCCESLGMWPIFWSLNKPNTEHIVDTSAYCFTNNFIKNTCHLWHSGVWGEDRRYYNYITKEIQHNNFGTTGKHTMNYRLDDHIEKKYGSTNFFIDGNTIVKQHYGGKYPWIK